MKNTLKTESRMYTKKENANGIITITHKFWFDYNLHKIDSTRWNGMPVNLNDKVSINNFLGHLLNIFNDLSTLTFYCGGEIFLPLKALGLNVELAITQPNSLFVFQSISNLKECIDEPNMYEMQYENDFMYFADVTYAHTESISPELNWSKLIPFL